MEQREYIDDMQPVTIIAEPPLSGPLMIDESAEEWMQREAELDAAFYARCDELQLDEQIGAVPRRAS